MFRKFIGPLLAACSLASAPLMAQTVKIGLINSYTGFVAQAADEAQKGIDLYVKEHEKDLPPGVKIELLRRDDTSNPEVGKRLAQELITRDHVQLLTGIVLSPVAAAVAPLTAEAKLPMLLSIAAAGAAIPRLSPYVVRISFTLWQQAYPIGKWAAEQGWKSAYTAVSDFIPGHDSELPSPRPSPMRAAKSSGRCGFRQPIPTSRRLSSVSRTPSRRSSSSLCPPALRRPR